MAVDKFHSTFPPLSLFLSFFPSWNDLNYADVTSCLYSLSLISKEICANPARRFNEEQQFAFRPDKKIEANESKWEIETFLTVRVGKHLEYFVSMNMPCTVNVLINYCYKWLLRQGTTLYGSHHKQAATISLKWESSFIYRHASIWDLLDVSKQNYELNPLHCSENEKSTWKRSSCENESEIWIERKVR